MSIDLCSVVDCDLYYDCSIVIIKHAQDEILISQMLSNPMSRPFLPQLFKCLPAIPCDVFTCLTSVITTSESAVRKLVYTFEKSLHMRHENWKICITQM